MKKEVTPDRAHESLRLAAFLLVFISGVAFFLTDKLPVSSLILLVALPVAWFAGKNKQRAGLWEAASFLYLIFFFVDLLRVSHSLAPALVHLFIFIMVNKVFNLRSERDYYQLYLLTFLSLLAASSLSVETIMFYVIICYFLVLVWNVFSLTLYKEWRVGEDLSSFPFSFFSPSYFAIVAGSTVAVFLIGLSIFFILPRMQLGYFAGLAPGKVQHVSGFSQKVDLGAIAEIQENRGETMRVKVTAGFPLKTHRFYWRGISFDRYDGKSWSTAYPGTRFLFEDSSNTFYNSYSSEDSGMLVKQEFYLSPLNTRVIFGQDRVVKVTGNFSAVTRDTNGTLVGMGKPQNYEVFSKLITADPRRLRSKSVQMSDTIKRFYTQLPFRSSRIETLAKNVTASAGNNFDKVLAVQKYLEDNYDYTTSDLPQDSRDPVSVFLFERKAGHCEYFATGMVLMLRHLGIPARIVNGFLEGEYNEIGDFYLVRQSDAHSWVEVYFGEQLWLPFDPSPRTVITAGQASWWRYLDVRKVIDSINFFWDRYILIFSAQDQLDALSAARDQYQEISAQLKSRSEHASGQMKMDLQQFWIKYRTLLILAAVVVVAALLSLKLFLRRRQRIRLNRTPVLFYQEMLSILQKRGLARSPETTPVEFVRSVSEDIPSDFVQDLTSLTELFYQARFGNHILSAEEQASVRNSLRRLEEMP